MNNENYNNDDEFFRDYSKDPVDPLDQLIAEKHAAEDKKNSMVTPWLMRALALVFLALLFWLSVFIGSKLFQSPASSERTYLDLPEYSTTQSVDSGIQAIDFTGDEIAKKPVSEQTSPEAQSYSEPAASPQTPLKTATKVQQASVNGLRYSVMVGSFHSQESADRQAKALKESGFQASIESAEVNDQTVHRVLIGQGIAKEQADRLAAKARQSGYDVFVFQQ